MNFKLFIGKELIKKEYNLEIKRIVIDFDESISDECMSGLIGIGFDGN